MPQIIEVVERYEIPDIPDLSDLPEEDGIPLESDWHRLQITLLDDVVTQRWRDRADFFAGGNMFVYYSVKQARNRDYRGPDFFVVKNIDGSYSRQKWVVWEENGRYPDVIIELMSPSTAQEDLGPKKELYEKTFHTADYFCYDPDEQKLYGWQLGTQGYIPLTADEQGRLWSVQLEAWLGLWEGSYLQEQETWLRLFDAKGRLLPTGAEAGYEQAEAEHQRAEAERQRAEMEHQRAETERQRAEAAEAEIVRLREELARYQAGSEADA
jgi:Uma2 family endonuclease